MSSRKTAMLLAMVLVLAFMVSAVPVSVAQASYVDDFLATVGPMCTKDMRDNRILASFTLAQAIWESGWGRSTLATQANNLFGIRAYSTWDGKVYDRNECVLYNSWTQLVNTKGQSYVKSYSLSFWRAYDSWQESVNDHSDLFNRSSNYANLRGNFDYKSCATLIVQDGYCSETEYTGVLINLIESYELEKYNYDFGGNGGSTATPAPDVQTDPNGAKTIALSLSSLYMETGLSYGITATVTPDTAPYTMISTNSNIVSVSGNMLTAVGVGKADIVLNSGSLTVKCAVTVKDNYGGIVADGAFVRCTADGDEITVPAEATHIPANAFEGISASKVIVGNGVVSMDSGIFDDMGGGFTLCSYGNRVVSDYASANAIAHININTGWSLDNASSLVSGISLYTTVELINAYYKAQGLTVSLADSKGNPLDNTDYFGTGSTLTVGGASYKAIIKGDTDGNGIASTADLLTLKGYLGGDDSYLPARPYRKAADFNGDERITTADYLAIFRSFTA
ncbi:MAG: glucosaminidase domain-containing protein [Clostridia bacterium]|nr:glucosaminidase domain-containing protein [Clostridia bacterium]MBQ7047516.1 glucosaminidase domain-containing protein [Clostridia bacterium]